MAAMMSDGAAETMTLIRFLDDENCSTVHLCERIDIFLAHITWMFFSGGVFTVNSHTRFMVRWYEGSVHHFVVGGAGRSIGGIPFSQAVVDKCLQHMQAWVLLAKATVRAEFPCIDLINSFSAFKLPRDLLKTSSADVVTPEIDTKLKRLAHMLKRPHLSSQFRNLWFYAQRAFVNSNCKMSHWESWRCGMRMAPTKPAGDLRAVVKRGETFAPVTSGIESSFSKIENKLGQQRLHADSHVEDRSINLIMASLSPAQLGDLVNRAQTIWMQCCRKHTRDHLQTRSNKGVKRELTDDASLPAEAGQAACEKQFLKRLRSDIAGNANPNAASVLERVANPPCWSDSHEAELTFQKNKLQKKIVEAHLRGHLLPEEHTEALRHESVMELARQDESYRSRLNDRKRYAAKTTAVPPTLLEVRACSASLDDGLMWTNELRVRLGDLAGKVASDLHRASLFISADPRNPRNVLLTLAASLLGAWVVSPAVFLNNPGPCVKYNCGLGTKRIIWASPGFCRTFPHAWALILELLNVGGRHRWTVLGSVKEWATARAHAEKVGRPTEVLSLVSPAELNPILKHTFTLEGLIAFIAKNQDPNKGSIGLVDM